MRITKTERASLVLAGRKAAEKACVADENNDAIDFPESVALAAVYYREHFSASIVDRDRFDIFRAAWEAWIRETYDSSKELN